MTEIELHQTPESALSGPVLDPTGGRLVAWAKAADAANELAHALVHTDFVPRVKDRQSGQMVPISQGNATAQILMGDELGLSPLAALRSLFVVHGTPSMYARTMVALVQSHGHEVWTESTSDSAVTVCGRRKGTEHVERAAWTTARAQKARYTTNAKYQSNPQEMLYAKAAAEVCRKIAADVLAGIPATVEDLELDEPEATVTVTRGPAAKAQRKPKPAASAPAPAREPGLEPAPVPQSPQSPAEPVDAVPLRTEPQMRKLWALAKTIGLGDADDFKAYLSQELDRDVASTKDLTKDEAARLIDQLESVNPETGEVTGDNQ